VVVVVLVAFRVANEAKREARATTDDGYSRKEGTDEGERRRGQGEGLG